MTISEKTLAAARARLSKGRAFCGHRAPYVSTTLYGLVPHFIENFPYKTMAVSKGLVLYADIDWFMEEPAFNGPDGHEYVGGCLYHEINHIQRGMDRIERLTKSDPANADLANIAADLAINDTIIDAGWKLPPWVQRVSLYKLDKGKTMEWYFEELKKQKGNGGKFSPCMCGGIVGNPGGVKVEEEIDPIIGRTALEVENIKYTTNKKIQDHMKSRGNAPGFNIQELEFEKKPTVVPWPTVLQHVARRVTGQVMAGQDDYTFQRPNRRSIGLGVIRPSYIAQRCDVFFVRDTSGSMSDEDLNTANNEMISAMQKCGIDEVTYVDVDVVMHGAPKKVRTKDIPRLKALGRGGTCFIQVLKHVEQMKKKKPDVVVYLTDGYGSAPKEKPKGFEVIWALIPSSGNCARPAPWGHAVVCSNDPALRSRVEDQLFEDEYEED